MNAGLQAIKNAGDKGNFRQDVIKGFYAIKNKPSVLGTYSIDADGDTTITTTAGTASRAGSSRSTRSSRPSSSGPAGAPLA